MNCLRCGKCCNYEVNGYMKRCKYLVDTSDGKTLCRIYARRIGKIIDVMCGQVIVCGYRRDQNRFIEGCPLNAREAEQLRPPT